MNLYEFNNANLPELSSFRLATPSGWDLVENDEALMAVVTDNDGAFRPNVVITADRFVEGFALADFARGIDIGLRQAHPEVAISESVEIGIDGEPGLLRSIVRLTNEEGPFVFQVEVLMLAPSTPGGDRFLLQIHGCCDATQTEAWAPSLVDVIRSLHFLRDHEGAADLLSAAAG